MYSSRRCWLLAERKGALDWWDQPVATLCALMLRAGVGAGARRKVRPEQGLGLPVAQVAQPVARRRRRPDRIEGCPVSSPAECRLGGEDAFAWNALELLAAISQSKIQGVSRRAPASGIPSVIEVGQDPKGRLRAGSAGRVTTQGAHTDRAYWGFALQPRHRSKEQ